jgi:methylmalonyl-CoA decarboxylase
MPLIATEIAGDVATLTMTHFEKRNALSKELIDALLEGLASPKGSRVFSAGHDVNELPSAGRDPLGYSDPLEQFIRAIRQFNAPVLAMVEGSVWGGACEVCVSCDIVIATHTATFAATPAKIGVPYNTMGLLNFLNALGPRILRELLFTADPIAAERAFELGIYNHLVPAHEIEEFTYKMACRIVENSPLSISVMKEQIRILQNASPLSPETFERLQGLRRMVYDSADYEEGLRAFLEKRKPKFTGT